MGLTLFRHSCRESAKREECQSVQANRRAKLTVSRRSMVVASSEDRTRGIRLQLLCHPMSAKQRLQGERFRSRSGDRWRGLNGLGLREREKRKEERQNGVTPMNGQGLLRYQTRVLLNTGFIPELAGTAKRQALGPHYSLMTTQHVWTASLSL